MSAAAFKVPTIFSAIDKFTAPLRAMTGSVSAFASKTESSMLRANRALRSVQRGAGGAFDSIVNLRNAAALLFVGGIAKKVFDVSIATAKVGDEASKTGRVIGLSAEALQEFRFAGERAGIGSEALTNAFSKMNKNIGDLRAGTGTLQTILAKSNPVLSKQLKLAGSNEEAFNAVTDAINKMKSPFDKAALAQAAFGRSGQDMLLLMENGTAGIAALRAEARKYGGIVGNEAAKRAEAFVDAQENMNFALSGLQVIVGSALLPKIQSLMERFTEWTIRNRELIKTKATEFAQKLGNTLEWLVTNMDDIIRALKIFGGLLVTLKIVEFASNVGQMGITIFKAVKALWGLNFALLANPITWIVAGVIALIAVIVLLATKVQGWGAQWDEIMKFMTAVWDFHKYSLLDGFLTISDKFQTMVEGLVIAWKWGQNKMGMLSDQQYARDRALIANQQANRAAEITSNAMKAQDALAQMSKGIDMKLQWGGDKQAEQTPVINLEAARMDAMKQVIEKTVNEKATIDFKNLPREAQVTGDTKLVNQIKMSSTMAFG